MKPTLIQWREVYLCVALTTMGTLLLELSLTRIFSVVFMNHLAFLAISIALFGLGLGGVLSYLVAGWRAPLFTRLGRLSAANTVLILVALVVILAQGENPTNWNFVLIYFTTALPFVLSGAIVSTAISETIVNVDRVYFFDLLGAAAGCFVLLALLTLVGGIGAVIGAAITFAAAAAIWHSLTGGAGARARSVVLALALVAFLVFNQRHEVLRIRHAKHSAVANEVFKQWNTFSRVALVRDYDAERDTTQHTVIIDGDAATPVFPYDLAAPLTPKQQQALRDQGPGLPYALRPGAKTLIIGPGGGWDVARALYSGSRDVTGVEINPIIAETIMRQRFPDLSHGLYFRPDVNIYVEDGRSFVRRSADKYQVIQGTLVDTWASTAAGAFAFSENNLYTVDAFRDYLNHLTDDGILAMTRFGFEPPRESLRLISLAMEALSQLGERDAWRHVVVSGQGDPRDYGAQHTVLISRKPFTPADIDRVRAVFAGDVQYEVYYPGTSHKSHFSDYLLSPSPTEYQRNYPFDISPVTDNRPFFFYNVQPHDLWSFVTFSGADYADRKVNQAIPVLIALIGVSLIATLLILIAPPLVLGTRLPAHPGVRGFLLFFLFIGAGYILIEVALIQKFVLFLGHPTYALTVVIFSMLVSSGLGSFASRRLIGGDEGRLIKLLGVGALMAASLGGITGPLLTALVGLPIPLKVLITVALIAPLGFVMGMPFPTGLRRLEQWHAPSVRWAWSLNAASSVLGSVGAMVCAIYLGLVQTLIVGGLFYFAALAVIARVHPEPTPSPEPGPGRVVIA
jgi:spermidine synthase